MTKGVTATALAVAHARGLLDYDTPVAAYWPEFAQAGKEAITVRQVLAHQAGLATIDQRLRLVDLADQDLLAALIARTDPAGRTLGCFFAEEVAAPVWPRGGSAAAARIREGCLRFGPVGRCTPDL